jgi:hypothetical protein
MLTTLPEDENITNLKNLPDLNAQKTMGKVKKKSETH